ncbi:ATP-grasp domain-containing protein [Ancylobacter terrae]|uniref:ATP-grasp domain-containing protein n=1 Tax=Ancylobacter sp. sgz301288 TaxID=3342077 RepID=UPI00385EE90B
MPGRSPPEASPDIVVVATAARGLAAAARRAGLRPIALDLFADADTRALAVEAIPLRGTGGLTFDGDDLIEQLGTHAADGTPVVIGSGFEDQLALIEAIETRFALIGNGSRVIARLKQPQAFAALLATLSIPHPRLFFGPAPEGIATLEKRIGAAGGWHVRPAQVPRDEHWYLQEFLPGRTVSALFLGNGTASVLLGFSEQWCAPSPDAPYRYGGAAGPVALPAQMAHDIEAALARIVAATGMVGLASADIILGADGWHLIEVNPRPGATLDVFDHDPMPPLLRLHVEACEGRLPAPGTLPDLTAGPAHAAAVFYAPAPFEMRLDPLPDWVADRPATGTRLQIGEPVCTLLAEGRDVTDARRLLAERQKDLWTRLGEAHRKAAE